MEPNQCQEVSFFQVLEKLEIFKVIVSKPNSIAYIQNVKN